MNLQSRRSNHFITKYLDFVYKHYKWLFLSYVLLMSFFVYQSFQIKIDSNLYSLFPQKLTSMQNINKMQEYYGGTGIINVSVNVKNPDSMLSALLPKYINDNESFINKELKPLLDKVQMSPDDINIVTDVYSTFLDDMDVFYLPAFVQDIKLYPNIDKKHTKLFMQEYETIILPDIKQTYQDFISNPNVDTLNSLIDSFYMNIDGAKKYQESITNLLPKNREALLKDFSRQFARELTKDKDIVFVDYIFNQEYIEKNLLLMMDKEDIRNIDTELRNRINYERRKSVLSSFIFVDENEGDITFSSIKDKYLQARGAGVSRKMFRLQDADGLLAGETQGEREQFYFSVIKDKIFLNIRPSEGPSNIDYALNILDKMKDIFSKVQKRYTAYKDLEMFITGPYVDREEDAQTLMKDISSVTPIAFFLVCLVVCLYFRSFIAIFIVCVPLLSELLFALGFVKITYGYLNIISSFLVAIMSGMGVNFGTHLLSRYLESKGRGNNARQAMQEVFSTILYSNITATLTSAAGFFVLALSSFQGFKEFGIIAGIAMVSLLIGIFFAFPSFVFWLERYHLIKIRLPRQRKLEQMRGRKFPLYKLFSILGILGILASLLSLNKLEFNANFVSLLRNSKSTLTESKYYAEEVKDLFRMISGVGVTPIYAPDLKTYKEITDFLLHNRFSNSGFRFESMILYAPEEQEEKFAEIRRLKETLKSDLLNANDDPSIQKKLDFIKRLSQVKPVSIEAIPKNLQGIFKGIKPGYFILYYNTAAVSSISRVLDYHKDFELINTKFGSQGVFLASDIWIFGDLILALQQEGWLLTIAVMSALSFLLYLDFRSIRGVMVALVPLTMGMVIMFGLCVVFSVELNFFNVLMLPAIAGLGIDYGVHILHRIKEEGPHNILFTFFTTGRAMWVAGIQDITGFAVLLIAMYNGLVTTGALLILGAVGCLLIGSIVVPAFAQWMYIIKEKGLKASLFSLEGYIPNFMIQYLENKKTTHQ